MLKYVKEGALDLLAFTLPTSILDSIRQVSEDDFLSTQVSNRQSLPRTKRRNNTQSSWASSRAIAPGRRSHSIILSAAPTCSFESSGSLKPVIQLPYEILALIFQYLPASDLFSVVAVSRHWRQIAFLETKQVDLSECFPVDCLGLDNDVYSDFDFVCNLFSMFPLISRLVIKDRYMRDRDMRVVTAGILAGKMAFTELKGTVAGSDLYRKAQLAVSAKKKASSSDPNMKAEDGQQSLDAPKSRPKILHRTLKEELNEFSRSTGTYVFIPKARKTLKKKILERFEHNIERREALNYYWMYENNIDPAAYDSLINSSPFGRAFDQNTNEVRYPLVPMTHYRFSDCCFANDWGAAMDLNKLPMIGLAASISEQGLVVDLEGSYGAPSASIKTMLAFCFGEYCVVTLDLNFRHTHMELDHAVELLSINRALFKIDIVDSPAYRSIIRLPALRDLGTSFDRMHWACDEFDEKELSECLKEAEYVLSDLDKVMSAEEIQLEYQQSIAASVAGQPKTSPFQTTSIHPSSSTILNDFSKPIQSLASQLVFTQDTSEENRIRTANTLLRGIVSHGIAGLIDTKDQTSGQTLLHRLAWTNSYNSLLARPAGSLPTPPLHHQSSMNLMKDESLYFSSSAPTSSSLPTSSTSGSSFMSTTAHLPPNGPADQTENSAVAIEEESQGSTLSGLSSLISISTLSSALKLRRLSLPTTLWIPKDSEDVGVGGGSLPTPEPNDNEFHFSFDNNFETRGEEPAVKIDSPTIETCNNEETNQMTSERKVHIPENHPVAIALCMAEKLLQLEANPNVYNKDGRSAVVCASFKGFQPMESLLIKHGGHSKELIRIRETM